LNKLHGANNSNSVQDNMDNMDKLVPECQTILDFVAATNDGGDGGDDQNYLRRARLHSHHCHLHSNHETKTLKAWKQCGY